MTRPLPADTTSEAAFRHLGHITLRITRLPTRQWWFDKLTHTLYVHEDVDIVAAYRQALAALAPGARHLVCVQGGRTERGSRAGQRGPCPTGR